MIIKKILVFFICSIVPYISKGQCLDSLKSVCLPDSIAEQIENNYEDKYTNASKNVVNLISPNNYNEEDDEKSLIFVLTKTSKYIKLYLPTQTTDD